MLKAFTQEKLNQFQNIMFLSCSLLVLGLALYTLHDMQIAEGAGLYLSILYGQTNRIPFDILVDIMGMLLFLALLLLPCLLLEHLHRASFFRFLSVYLAMIPVAHPGNAVHVSDALFNLTMRESLLRGDILRVLFVECIPVFETLKFVLPFLLLLTFINKNLQLPGFQKKKYWSITLFIFLILYLLFENIEETLLYFLYYFLLIWCFGEWEATCKHSTRFANWSLILFAGCMLRGIYRMLELISHAHL